MPSRKELIKTIKSYTDNLSDIQLDKPHYKDAEANIILMNHIISYYSLDLVDEVKAACLRATACLSVNTFLASMRKIWADNPALRTQLQRNIIISIAHKLSGKSTIGRNQLITIILHSTQECLK